MVGPRVFRSSVSHIELTLAQNIIIIWRICLSKNSRAMKNRCSPPHLENSANNSSAYFVLSQVYQLPRRGIRQIALVLEALTLQRQELGLMHCAITMPNLEEVFHSCTAQAQEQQPQMGTDTAPAEHPGGDQAEAHHTALEGDILPPLWGWQTPWSVAFSLILYKCFKVTGGFRPSTHVMGYDVQRPALLIAISIPRYPAE